MGKFWIQKAIKKPGSFTRYAKKHHWSMGQAISHGIHSKNSTTRHRALLARTLRKMHHH